MIVCLATVLGGAALPASTSLGGVSPTLDRRRRPLARRPVGRQPDVRKRTDWKIEMPGSRPGPPHEARAPPGGAAAVRRSARRHTSRRSSGWPRAVTLAAGVGAPVVRATCSPTGWGSREPSSARPCSPPATALPEISSGIAAVRLGDHQLAVGDILGGNSFQLTLFLLADILAGTPGDRRRARLGRLAGRGRAADDRDRRGGGDRAAEAHVPLARDRLDRAGRDLRGRDRAAYQRSRRTSQARRTSSSVVRSLPIASRRT